MRPGLLIRRLARVGIGRPVVHVIALADAYHRRRFVKPKVVHYSIEHVIGQDVEPHQALYQVDQRLLMFFGCRHVKSIGI